MTRKNAATAAAALAAAAVLAAGAAMTKETVWPASSIQFKEALKGVSKAPLWGAAEGEHGGLTRLAAGFKAGTHTHTWEVRMVVVDGTIIHTDAAGIVTKLKRGSYLMVPGGVKHDTACAAGKDCLFFESQPGAFDLKPDK